jgi:hypothetical protein
MLSLCNHNWLKLEESNAIIIITLGRCEGSSQLEIQLRERVARMYLRIPPTNRTRVRFGEIYLALLIL